AIQLRITFQAREHCQESSVFQIQAAARRRLVLEGRPTALASSRMPTRTSPQRPIPAPQSAHLMRLSSVEWSGTMNLVLPHLRHLSGEACVSALIGSSMNASILVGRTTAGKECGASLFSKRSLSRRIAARSGWHPLFACVIGLLHSQNGLAGRPD